MTALANIRDITIVQGQDAAIIVTISDGKNPIDVTGHAPHSTICDRIGNSIIYFSGDDSTAAVTDGPAGKLQLDLDNSKAALLNIGTRYVWDLWLVRPSNSHWPIWTNGGIKVVSRQTILTPSSGTPDKIEISIDAKLEAA